MIKTAVYQLFGTLLGNIGGELGNSLRGKFYKLAGVKMAQGAFIRERGTIYGPYNLEMGRNAELGVGCVISAIEKVKIGNDVGIGPYCVIYDNGHKMPKFPGKEGLLVNPVEIGDNSWIGTHSIILRGVKIGKNVTVGAGSVVVKDIPDNAVVVGNPARIVKYNQSIE